MSTINKIKEVLTAMLPSGQRMKITKHIEVNDKIIDYMYIPFGVPFPYLGTTIPSNCHLCNGASILRTNAPLLFDEIGTTFGSVDGDHFNLPNIPVGGSIVQAGTREGVNFILGADGGEVKHLLTAAESGLPSHNHISVTEAKSTNQRNADENSGPYIVVSAIGTNGYSSISTQNVNAVNASAAHNNMSPYMVGNWIIRLK